MENRGNVIVDFANCRLHINSIIPSATQEEVLFSVRPECFLGMMVCQQMDPCDVILIQGARQIVGYKGYALSFVYDGILDVPFGDACGEVVLAIDSAIGRAFDPKTGNRDMNKAAVGFAACRDLVGDAVISTGGWGTGAFGQDHSVKFLHQIIAAAAAGVKLEYAAFFKPAEEARYKELMEGVLRATPRVCDLWAVIQADLESKGDFEAALVKAGICKGR
jgi:hypothetical protein